MSKALLSDVQNQRVSPRKNLRTRVFFEDDANDELLYFLSTDLSLSGIFIESEMSLQEHSKVFLKFSIFDGDEPIRVTAEVTRWMEEKRGPGRRKKQKKGIGLRFIGLSLPDLKKIEQYIHS